MLFVFQADADGVLAADGHDVEAAADFHHVHAGHVQLLLAVHDPGVVVSEPQHDGRRGRLTRGVILS